MALTSTLREHWDRMAKRERRLLLALGVVIGAGIFGTVTSTIVGGIEDLAQQNDTVRQALHDLDAHRDELLAMLQTQNALERRIVGSPAPALTGYVGQIATAAGITIPESQENPAVTVGPYTKTSITLSLRGIDVTQLGAFMSQVEGGPHLVVIERMEVTPRFNQHDQLDVDMTVATYTKGAAATGAKGTQHT